MSTALLDSFRMLNEGNLIKEEKEEWETCLNNEVCACVAPLQNCLS